MFKAAIEEEFCIEAENELRKLGVTILTNTQVTKLSGKDKVEKVILNNDEWIRADLVIFGVGAAPNTIIAEKNNIPFDRGGIIVDKYMRTGIDDIYAAGDCAQKFSFITGKASGVRLASVAAYEGIVAANNMLGNRIENKGAVGAFSTKIGNIALGSSGLTQNACKKKALIMLLENFQALINILQLCQIHLKQ